MPPTPRVRVAAYVIRSLPLQARLADHQDAQLHRINPDWTTKD